MVIGRGNALGQPIVPIVIAGANGREEKIPFLLATGFRGSLMLPPEQVAALGLPQVGTGPVTYPIGSQGEAPVYEADILWCGEKRTVIIIAWGLRPIMGTELLRGYNVRMELTEGGRTTVEPI